MVVANLLHTRYQEVQLVSPSGVKLVQLAGGLPELEASFVRQVAEAHYAFISESDSPFGQPPKLRPPPTRTLWQRLAGLDLGLVVMALILGPGVALLSMSLQRQLLSRLKRG